MVYYLFKAQKRVVMLLFIVTVISIMDVANSQNYKDLRLWNVNKHQKEMGDRQD